MKHNKKFWLVKPVHILPMALCVVMCISIYFINRLFFYIAAPIVLATVCYCGYRFLYIQKDLYKTISSIGRAMTNSNEASLMNFPLSCMIVSDIGEIIWYNDLFRKKVLKRQKDIFGYNIKTVVKTGVSDLLANQGMVISYNDLYYEVFCLKTVKNNLPIYLVYLVDVTTFKKNALETIRKKPVIMLIIIDNYEESIGNENESDKAKLLGEVRNVIQNFADNTTGFIRKIEQDRYLVVMENSSFDDIVKNRFNLLDKVREIPTGNRIPVTLSIGAAKVNDTFAKAEQEVRQALDMALGRGGDQAAIKTDGGYEFFGGYSKGVEKHTKVKTRIVASAMAELIKAADNVLVMGHAFADLDSLGASIGMAKTCHCLGKRVNIVLDEHRNLADVLVKRLVENDKQNLLCLPDMAINLIKPKTLLIIVDTHTETLLESKEIYERCKQVVVIDHHRKLVNHIKNAVIFYHEPYASSACEMVTELIQYFGDTCKLSSWEAEALLSGIMLDTKNFIIRTGVRTFEASAYLRRLGADTMGVRKLFSSTMDSYQRKARIVSLAELYNGCAIAVCNFSSDDLRIVAPQAADELLDISGVKASFVLYEENESINISARSMGEMNVQIIMEQMGGGGHQTMAGVQVVNSTCDKVKQTLLEVIDKQQEDLEKQ